MTDKKIPNPYIVRQPTAENSNHLAFELARAGWVLWQNQFDNQKISEYGFELMYKMNLMGVLCNPKTAKPFTSREQMREKFEKWINKHNAKGAKDGS